MADYNFITKRIATGAALEGPADVEIIVNAGITHVVDARTEFDDGPLLAASQMKYLYDPTNDDGQKKGVDWFKPALEFCLSALSQPKTKVYLHCAAGVNRGPSLAGTLLVALGFSTEDALRVIQAARPQAQARYLEDGHEAARLLGYV